MEYLSYKFLKIHISIFNNYWFYRISCRDTLEKCHSCIIQHLNAYVNKTYNRHFKWDTFRVIILTCQEFFCWCIAVYHIFGRFYIFIYPRHNVHLLANSQRKRRLIQNLIIKFLISTIPENRAKDGYNLEKAPKRQ